jgi:hypothetical protein
MPLISSIFIRWSFIQLAIASTIGLIMLISKATGDFMWIWVDRPIHSEGMWIGWIINFVLGTAWWIMPKRPDFPDKYGNSLFAWIAFIFLQLDWMWRLIINPNYAPLLLRFTPVIGIFFFILGIWPRLKYMVHQH